MHIFYLYYINAYLKQQLCFITYIFYINYTYILLKNQHLSSFNIIKSIIRANVTK